MLTLPGKYRAKSERCSRDRTEGDSRQNKCVDRVIEDAKKRSKPYASLCSLARPVWKWLDWYWG
jgi:hypothetical protein